MSKFRYVNIEDGIEKSPFDDKKMRLDFIKFARNVLNAEYIDGSEFGIDLIRSDNPECGAEGERGSWKGDRWVGNQRNIFNCPVNTLNIQNRKWHFWGLHGLSNKNEGYNAIQHKGFEHNVYFRVNKDKDQICIIDSKTIRDLTKRLIVEDRIVGNNDEPEDWICVPQKYVMTYNKQHDGSWILNGDYCGLSQEEWRVIEKLKAAEAFKRHKKN